MAPSVAQINGDTNGHDANWIPVVEQPALKPRKLRVVCIGAGFAGLLLAHKSKYEQPMTEYMDLTIYEKNNDIGGTWFENRYPGVACDVPAHIYTFPFAPNPDWSSFYAGGPEIWEYMRNVTTKYQLDEKVQFNAKVIETIWNDAKSVWKIKVQRDGGVITDEAEVLVNGAGILNKRRWPTIDGLDSFQGTLMHSAAWNHDFDFSGKRVALIGNGSSAIQLLPQLQTKVSHLTAYIRTPTWITTNFVSEHAKDGKNFQYTEEEKKEFRENPEVLKDLRKKIEHTFNSYFYGFFKDSPMQKELHGFIKKQMEQKLNNDPDLCAKLIPDWGVGCRRLTPGDGYLEALQEQNIRIEFDDITRISPTGIETKNGLESFDIIVCATGFDVSFSPFWNLEGKNGIKLADKWADDPQAYFGICAADVPNYFIYNGPNCPIGHGSLISVMDWTTDYILRWIRKISTQNIKSISVSHDAVHDYNVYIQEFLKRTVWTSGCRSWYKNGKIDGKVTAMYGGSILHYKDMLEAFRTEDFEFEYLGKNRFACMGNGLAQVEVRPDLEEHGLAYYLKC